MRPSDDVLADIGSNRVANDNWYNPCSARRDGLPTDYLKIYRNSVEELQRNRSASCRSKEIDRGAATDAKLPSSLKAYDQVRCEDIALEDKL